MTCVAVGRIRVERVRVEPEAGDRQALRGDLVDDLGRLARRQVGDVDVARAGVAPGRPGRVAASRRSRGPRSRWRPPSRRPPSAASRGTGRSGSRASSSRLQGMAWGRRLPASGRRRPSDPRGRSRRWRRRRASRRGRRRTWHRQVARPGDRRRRRRRRHGRGRRTCRRSPRRGRPAGPTPSVRPAPISAGFRRRSSFARSRCPIHRWSGVSESQAAALVAPSISHWSEFLRPALICETATAPRAPLAKRSRIDATSSVAISALDGVRRLAPSRTSRPAHAARRGPGRRSPGRP